MGRKQGVRLCSVCETLPPGELIELDRILGDPLTWPSTVWKGLDPPTGGLPATYRRLGAANMGAEWLKANGHDISLRVLKDHIAYDVPLQAVTVDELLARGLIALDREKKPRSDVEAIDPLNYIKLYNEGVKIGIRGLALLWARADAYEQTGEEVPDALIKQMTDIGTKLAMSQAAIRAAGKPFGEGGDTDDAFRGGDDISPRFAGNRVREIDGVSRPVADEGPADRTHYNERAAHEGGSPIGGR
jgi:hypothetical protein